MDGFDKKRKMIGVLQSMLKHNASEEVSKSLPQEKPALPKIATGGMVDLTKKGASLEQPTSDDMCMAHGGTMPEHGPDCHYAEGGMAGSDMSVSDEASRLTEPVANPSDSAQDESAVAALPGAIEDEGAEKDALQAVHNEDMMDEDEDSNQSAFDAFMPRKRK